MKHETSSVTARWKKKYDQYPSGVPFHYFVATCGACPACLGHLQGEPRELAELDGSVEAMNFAKMELAVLGAISSNVESDDEAERIKAILLDRAEAGQSPLGLLTGASALIDQVIKRRGFNTDNQRWRMDATQAFPAQPALYYGFGDSEYRISFTCGKRAPGGQRISRRTYLRPNTNPATPVPAIVESLSPDGRRDVRGQRPVPPCRIRCVLCSRLNDVPMPRGFRQLEDGSIEECTDAVPGATM